MHIIHILILIEKGQATSFQTSIVPSLVYKFDRIAFARHAMSRHEETSTKDGNAFSISSLAGSHMRETWLTEPIGYTVTFTTL